MPPEKLAEASIVKSFVRVGVYSVATTVSEPSPVMTVVMPEAAARDPIVMEVGLESWRTSTPLIFAKEASATEGVAVASKSVSLPVPPVTVSLPAANCAALIRKRSPVPRLPSSKSEPAKLEASMVSEPVPPMMVET